MTTLLVFWNPCFLLLRFSSDVNASCTSGDNEGIAYSLSQEECNYILVLNDEVVLNSGFLNEFVSVAEKNPKIGL